MAEKPKTEPFDPDAPTDAVVKQALDAVPSWEEWLRQNHFKLGKEDKYAWSDVEWNRHWPHQGRGWQIKVYPERHVITADVYNNILRWGRSFVKFYVNEGTLAKVVGQIIKEIERNISDQSRKRRIKALKAATPDETRIVPDVTPVNGPVRPVRVVQGDQPHHWVEFHNEPVEEAIGPIRRPVPDNPDDLNAEQMDQLLSRVRVRCFPIGTRVRVRSPRETGLNGEMGTVVDAGPHSCYVAIDSYVQMGDHDPFRFEEHELQPVYENQQADLDDPRPYMAALDWMSALKMLGYTLLSGTWRKSVPLDSEKGYLRIMVEPDEKLPAAVIYIDYRSTAEGETERIQDIVVPAIDVVDTVREIEALRDRKDVWGITDFAKALAGKHYKGTPIPPLGHLTYLFGESIMEANDDPDAPERYVQELGRHYDVINAFREHGVRMRRRMRTDHPYYEMFWIPNAVTEVSYDLFIQPDGEGWSISARGSKRFDDDRFGQFDEEFDIDHTWYIGPGDDLAVEVDNILSALGEYQGPEEPTINEPDYDDVDESVDDITDLKSYAMGSANWNPVMMLTSKDIRKIIREAGFKVNTCYRSRITHGWVTTSTPATDEAFRLMRENPHRMAEYLNHQLREGIMKRLPELAKIERGMYNLDDKLHISTWDWSGATSADPENPNNYVIYADIQPSDYMKRRRGGKMEEAEEPDEIKDLAQYAQTSGTSVQAIEQAGYTYGFDRVGRERWNKYWQLPQPLRNEKPWSPIWNKFWGSPDPWGQYVYGITSDDFVNATAGGYIVVRPVKAPANPEGWDYSTSVRRVLLKVEQMVRNMPKDTTDIDVMRNYVFTEMERIKNEVNAEADATNVEEVVVEGVDDPEEVLPVHKPYVYGLYGEYDNYRAAVSFGTYTSLAEAVQQALMRQLHDEYQYVWAEEYEIESLEDWDSPKNKAVDYTGNKFRILPDGTTEKVQENYLYTGHYPRPPRRVGESDEDIDPAKYAAQTFDAVRFLEAQGWKKIKTEAYEYWGKDYPLPHPYYLGGMEFTHLRAIIGFDPRVRGYFSCSVNIYWNDATGHGFPVKGWNLEPQLVYPQLPDAEDISDKDLDYDMPLRRFATGIDKVIEQAFVPNTESALHANTHIEAAVGRFVTELNHRADKPLYDRRPEMEEAQLVKT